MEIGFIREKIEIKFLILYVLAHMQVPIPLDGVQKLTMIDEGIDYFAFSECLNDLVETGHLRLSEDGMYAITQKGIRNSEICESGLPYSVRLRADKEIDAYCKELKRQEYVKARYHRRDNGTYTVELSLSDEVDNLMNLSVMVANEAIAEALKKRFLRDPEGVYGQLMETLYR